MADLRTSDGDSSGPNKPRDAFPATHHEIGKGIAVERTQERIERRLQRRAEVARGRDPAVPGFRVEPVDERHRLLRMSNDVADTNRLWRPRQPRPTAAAPNRFE